MILNDDGIVVVGHFSKINNYQPANGSNNFIARLMSDGSTDIGFNTPTLSRPLSSVAAFSNGRLMITSAELLGNFVNAPLKLLENGQIDSSYSRNQILGSLFSGVLLLDDGKALCTGELVSPLYSATRGGLTRFDRLGNIDPTFDSSSSNLNGASISIKLSNEKILVSGFFDGRSVIRLNNDSNDFCVPIVTRAQAKIFVICL